MTSGDEIGRVRMAATLPRTLRVRSAETRMVSALPRTLRVRSLRLLAMTSGAAEISLRIEGSIGIMLSFIIAYNYINITP